MGVLGEDITRRLLLAAWLLAVGFAGCRSTSSREDDDRRPPPGLPAVVCGELQTLPGRPLLAITRQQCLQLGLTYGRVREDSYPYLMMQFWKQALGSKGNMRETSTAALEPPMELTRLTEDLVRAINRAYWDLRTAYGVYLTREAALLVAREQEALAEKLVASGRLTQLDREKTRQARLGLEAERLDALFSGERPGLLEAEMRLRYAIGFCPQESGLLLPVDCPPLAELVTDSSAWTAKAFDRRLEMVASRFRLIVAQSRYENAKEKLKKASCKQLQQVQGELIRRQHQVELEVEQALGQATQRLHLTALAAERRQSVERQLAEQARLLKEAATDRIEWLDTKKALANAVRDEYLAQGAYCQALVELDRASGSLLVRDGIRVPSGNKTEPPQPSMPEPEPPVCRPLALPVAVSLEVLAASGPAVTLSAVLEAMSALPGPGPSPQPNGVARPTAFHQDKAIHHGSADPANPTGKNVGENHP